MDDKETCDKERNSRDLVSNQTSKIWGCQADRKCEEKTEEHTEEQDVMPEHQEEQIVYAHFQDQVKGDDQE